MWALRHPAEAAEVPWFAGWFEVRGVALGGLIGAGVAATGALPAALTAILAVAAIHGGLAAAALVWGGVRAAEAGTLIGLLALARGLAALHPVGALGYLAVPVWLARLAGDGRLVRLGLGRPWPWGAVAIGAFAGFALALHLVTCASRTLGYGIRFDPAVFLPALAYDVGANIVSAELFFRGALLQHLWRRWRFGLALAVAAAATAARYCLDPFVLTTELRLGAAVYMTLLAILNGVLYRWSGSLLPGVAAAGIFFACYRLLATG